MPSLDGLRHYCRTQAIEGEGTDSTLALCYAAAIEYLMHAGVPIPDEEAETPTYDLAVYMLASTWYDARGSVIVGQVPQELARSVQAIIHQLRY